MNAAKWAIALLVAFIGALTSGRASTVLLNDTFSGSSLDASLWQTILPNGSSSVTQSGGGLTTTARGILGSVAGFSGPLTLSGTFTLLNDSEHFKIVLRSDLTSTGSYDERTGLIVAFANDGDNAGAGTGRQLDRPAPRLHQPFEGLQMHGPQTTPRAGRRRRPARERPGAQGRRQRP
jgi:hypothetical protein